VLLPLGGGGEKKRQGSVGHLLDVVHVDTVMEVCRVTASVMTRKMMKGRSSVKSVHFFDV
jgi:hypothetical protein